MCRCCSVLVYLLCVSVLVGRSAGFGADDPPPQVVKAIAAYDKARAAARENLLKGFDTVADRIANSKIAAADRLKQLEALQVQRERFEKQGLVPWSRPMWPYTANYTIATSRGEAELRRVYGGLIDRALKGNNKALADKLDADLLTALDAKVVARWEHTIMTGKNKKGAQVSVIELLSNGKIGAAGGDATWTLQRNGNLELRWPDKAAPGGAWVDSLQVSEDGTRYDGMQGKTQLAGRYVLK